VSACRWAILGTGRHLSSTVRHEGDIGANRLADATSPYLLQHADNPVDWWEWGA
jgi:hypothetical protein